jgi:Ca-activated chloride channel family protein
VGVKISRVVLLAAAGLCCTGLLSETALAANVPSAWSKLWRTPDQQGQALLDAGQPAQAAARFQDPRRRAYADLEARGYGEAAKLLAPFNDAQSEYNRGNALAESGQLQAALAAYDAALKQAPADQDIRHNRDLVERALQQQRQRQSPQSRSKNGRQDDQANRSQGQQSRQSNPGQQRSSGSQQSGGASQRSGGASQQSRAGGGSQSTNSNQATPNGSQAGANRPGDSSEAQRDAAFAAAHARTQRQQGATGNTAKAQGSQQNGKAPNADSLLAGGAQTPKQKPESERQMALDQWLRQIPDSPAGLLQRKFLIEHIMRQQGGEPLQSVP